MDLPTCLSKAAGSPPSVACAGLDGPGLPASGIRKRHGDVFQGTPTPVVESCDTTVDAHSAQDGIEERLRQMLHLNVAPVCTPGAFASSRCGLVNDDMYKHKGTSIGGMTPSITSPRLSRAQGPVLVPSAPPVTTDDAQVMQLLATAA
ncbi:hypothetical protein EV401DRAFT_1888569 [Pisolithus croceorrhizus]|nr:hypothetical protein EV401DRAFT_1888569 [Pisolithus croceorrhizus]